MFNPLSLVHLYYPDYIIKLYMSMCTQAAITQNCACVYTMISNMK